MDKSWFSKFGTPPAGANGVFIAYDPDDDVLLITSACGPKGEDVAASAEMRIERKRDIVIEITRSAGEPWSVYSIALTNASRHTLWADLFRSLEIGLRERKPMKYTLDPSRWTLE